MNELNEKYMKTLEELVATQRKLIAELEKRPAQIAFPQIQINPLPSSPFAGGAGGTPQRCYGQCSYAYQAGATGGMRKCTRCGHYELTGAGGAGGPGTGGTWSGGCTNNFTGSGCVSHPPDLQYNKKSS